MCLIFSLKASCLACRSCVWWRKMCMLEENFVNKSKIRFQSMITAKKMPIINKTAVSYSTSHSKSCQEIQEDTGMKKKKQKISTILAHVWIKQKNQQCNSSSSWSTHNTGGKTAKKNIMSKTFSLNSKRRRKNKHLVCEVSKWDGKNDSGHDKNFS